MPVINSYIGRNQEQPDGKRHIHEYHEGSNGKTQRFAYTAPVGFDIDAQMAARVAEVNESLADAEVAEALVMTEGDVQHRHDGEILTDWTTYRVPPVEQIQIDFDRRFLGILMTVKDVNVEREGLEFFRAMETRNGGNKNARADNLGVPRPEYSLVDAHFNNIDGIAFTVDDMNGEIWDAPLAGWD